MGSSAGSEPGGTDVASTRNNRVRLHGLEVRGGRVRCGVTSTGTLDRYFEKGRLELKYDVPVDGIDASMLYIPFVASVLPIAMLAGGDIAVPCLDAEYLRSVSLAQSRLKNWRPEVPFSATIAADEVRTNAFAEGKRCGLLYSGGVDSTCSLLLNRERLSTLVMVGGTEDLPLGDRQYWQRFRSQASTFAGRNGVSLHFVECNWLSRLRLSRLTQDFSASLAGTGRRDDVGNWEEIFRMVLLGMCAPVTVSERLGGLLMASTFPAEVVGTLGRAGPVEESLVWGDLSIARDSTNFTRQQKIRNAIVPYLSGNEDQIPIRVCHPIHLEKNRKLRQKGVLNCSNCQKCIRTILGLVLDGVDPRRCGFEQGPFSADSLRRQLVDRSVRFTGSALEFWGDIRRHVEDRPARAIELNLWNCNGFFDWLATYDVSRNLAADNEPLEES